MVIISLKILFGKDISSTMLPYYKNGKPVLMNPGKFILELFSALILRRFSPQLMFFPFSTEWYITPHDREMLRNC
jgi:hypothetical protein